MTSDDDSDAGKHAQLLAQADRLGVDVRYVDAFGRERTAPIGKCDLVRRRREERGGRYVDGAVSATRAA